MNDGCDSYYHIRQNVGLQIHVHTLVLACQHVVTKRAKKEEMYNKCHIFKGCIRQCDRNAVISAFRRLISLFKYSAEEEEARICYGGGWGGVVAERLRV